MILIGAPEPEEGWLLEDVEAALYQAERLKRVMPRSEFIAEAARGRARDHLGSLI